MYRKLIILLGLAHGVSDCISGYLIGQLSQQTDLYQTGLLIILYNALAFAMQLPLGIWIDTRRHPKTWCLAGLGSVAFSLTIAGFSPVLAVVCGGLGSAVFHVTGGRASLMATPFKAGNPGIFAAPGVVGLIIGGWLAVQHPVSIVFFIVLAGLLILLIALQKFPETTTAPADKNPAHTLETHDFLMIALLIAIAMRSVVWNIFQQVYIRDYEFLFYMAASAMGGKLAGGFLADRLGWRNYVFFALLLATPLLTWGENNKWLVLPGIALLQSVTPVAMAAMYRLLPRYPATGTGLTLGLAIAMGGLIFYAGLSADWLNFMVPVLVLGAMGGYGWVLQTQKTGLETKG